MTTWSGEHTASHRGRPCGWRRAHRGFPRKEQTPEMREKCSYSILVKFKTFVWASMNILVNMSVMRRSSVPESILQTNRVSVSCQTNFEKSPAIPEETLKPNKPIFPVCPMSRCTVGNDVRDVLNMHLVVLHITTFWQTSICVFLAVLASVDHEI